MEGGINPKEVTYTPPSPRAGSAHPDPSLADISLPRSYAAHSKDGDSILGRLTEMPPFPPGYHQSVAGKERGCEQQATAREMTPACHPSLKEPLLGSSVSRALHLRWAFGRAGRSPEPRDNACVRGESDLRAI